MPYQNSPGGRGHFRCSSAVVTSLLSRESSIKLLLTLTGNLSKFKHTAQLLKKLHSSNKIINSYTTNPIFSFANLKRNIFVLHVNKATAGIFLFCISSVRQRVYFPKPNKMDGKNSLKLIKMNPNRYNLKCGFSASTSCLHAMLYHWLTISQMRKE